MKQTNALWEAVKFPLRVLVLAVLPFAVAYVTEMDYKWAGEVTAILVFLDKYLHERWKLNGERKEQVKGIVPF